MASSKFFLWFGFVISFLSQVKYIVGCEILLSSQVHETIGGLFEHFDGFIVDHSGSKTCVDILPYREARLAVRCREQLGWMSPLGPLVSLCHLSYDGSHCKDNTSQDHFRSVNLYKEFAYRSETD